MTDIPDEAVEAAARVIDNPDDPCAITDIARTAIAAALPHLSPGNYTAELCAELEDKTARIKELEDALSDMECSCLPHAEPHDGMCQRCMALGRGQ